jgi:hypothetical protein
MPPTRSLCAVAVALAVAATACESTLPRATSISQLASYELYALTGAPPRATTAISFAGGGSMHADATFAFDLAFDMDTAGKVVVYPVRAVAGNLAGTQKRVGMQVVPGLFETVGDVPNTGYDTLNAKTVVPGTTVAVELQEPLLCQFSLGGILMYGKFVVDSVYPVSRHIFVSTVIDPNCGYRQVKPDTIPDF